MSNKDLSEAIKSIIEKEFKNFSKLMPVDMISNIEEILNRMPVEGEYKFEDFL